jgi:LPPG:FO 2-phospho-L-lactate transferase
MITLLCGGVGGSKLALGLYCACPPNSLTVIVNTADDVEILGLHISPDLDTVTYTLANLVNQETGWGIAGDTFNALDMLGRYGEETWFKLGDRDLATHIWRTAHLRRGTSLTDVTCELAQRFGIHARILPMCDQPVMTRVLTEVGWLPFQDYFVRRRHADTPLGVVHEGLADARLRPEVREAIQKADSIVIAPSNPVVSIGPILGVPGMRALLANAQVPRIAVSPIVGGKAVSGPAGQLMQAQGYEISPFGVAQMYRGLIDVLIIDRQDNAYAAAIKDLGIRPHIADTLMTDLATKQRLAREIVKLGMQELAL